MKRLLLFSLLLFPISVFAEGGLPGSSAHGEHPKFVALLDGEPPHQVLVKFSPSMTSRVGERWADLLVAGFESKNIVWYENRIRK